MARRVYEDPDINGGSTMVTLTKNWRSHNAILSYPNEAFYHAALEACGPPEVVNCLVGSPVLPNPAFPVVFHGVNGCDEREARSPSHFNDAEKNIVVDYIERLLADRSHPVEPEEIGVISPYNGQTRKLREAIKPRWRGVHIGTVEDFQAREYKVIVITTVRSNPSNMERDRKFGLGFLVNPKRVNVALTRAKSLLIVVGNPNLLGLEPLWGNMWRYVHRNGGTTGLLPDWNTEDWGMDDELRTGGDADIDDLMRMEDEGTWRVDQD
ncbi:hypothetical protein FRB99_001340 [Tulasnella sp. 403]|nr:hypothetical protein FRB99_001340 [Tulasnella sp. 403]